MRENHRDEEQLMSTTLNGDAVAHLKGEISGSVLGPQDAGYDAARAVHNGLVDRRPAVIVRCGTTNDVVAALAFARRTGLEVSIRGGGHNVAGRAVTDGGLMIDLAQMKAIAIDPGRATATAEGGVLWRELNDAAAKHGLAVTGGAVSGTGIAGYTLGGGLGWLMAKYGLAADNLVAVKVVTAEGDILYVDAAAHPDLAGVGGVHSGKHLDQGGLAGAVLTEKGMYLAGPYIEVDRVEGERAGEALGQPPDVEEGSVGVRHLRMTPASDRRPLSRRSTPSSECCGHADISTAAAINSSGDPTSRPRARGSEPRNCCSG